ncbi:MAG: aldo/keto reductase, partial [Phenylobacterium sp.]
MRYRAMGRDGAIASCVSLQLAPDPALRRPGDWVRLIYAALECGISTFEVAASDPVLDQGLAEALSSVDRRLVYVVWRVGARRGRDFLPETLNAEIGAALKRTGLDYLDAVLLDEPRADELQPESMDALKQMRAGGALRQIGVAGEDDCIDAYISAGGFDLLATPFNLISGWKERRRLRAAAARDMAVIGYNPYPRDFHASQTAAMKQERRGARHPLAEAGSYAFLDRTHGWTAEEICIAYALTEPALSTVLVRTAT